MTRTIFKTKIFILFLFVVSAVNVKAQSKEKFTVDSLAWHRTLSMKKLLSLDSIQTVKITVLNKEYLQNMQNIGTSKKAVEKRANDANDAKGQYEKQIGKILSEEQLTSYKAEEEKRKQEFEKKAAEKKIPVKKAG